MITITSGDLNALIAGFLWPLTRILGLITVAPLYGNLSVPVRVKLGLGIGLSLIVAPTLQSLPNVDPMSVAGVLLLTQQAVIGLALGFAMRIAFVAVEFAGEIIGLSMGFGFATFFDPQTRGRTSAISQFLALLAIMLFLALNLHLTVLSTLVGTFQSMPISASFTAMSNVRDLLTWSSHIFSGGVQLALPFIAALLITNIALGILTRAAPQLNLFGIGFPVILGVGFIMLAIALPYLAVPVERLFSDGMETMARIGTLK
ncbi:flagellar biosynthetic protein FliR [Noviherbaspirillum humi]|uniref:Flagellar biosynthetic protein FliR n=1 Tax=Noviherbaspirillum humi TaxID=1688639 RepID=A0A239FVN9_9BURK|nr:flagellar biosynthetic protein FliR [Noviherbaspirillum humi]SNS61246.1 flagellar biosynthetic protein FliR [Noviherbaspirillum humi]